MTWAKLDDGILDNPKVVQVGVFGFAWYTAGLVYCNRNLTDGFIPLGVADRLLSPRVVEGGGKIVTAAMTCGMQGDDFDAERVIGWLVAAELWEPVPGGFRVHDFLEHNPSRDEVLELRKKRADAGRRGNAAARSAKAGASAEQVPRQTVEPLPSNGQESGKCPGKIPANLGPVPVPVPEKKEEDPLRAREAVPVGEMPEIPDALRGWPTDLALVAMPWVEKFQALPDRLHVARAIDRIRGATREHVSARTIAAHLAVYLTRENPGFVNLDKFGSLFAAYAPGTPDKTTPKTKTVETDWNREAALEEERRARRAASH